MPCRVGCHTCSRGGRFLRGSIFSSSSDEPAAAALLRSALRVGAASVSSSPEISPCDRSASSQIRAGTGPHLRRDCRHPTGDLQLGCPGKAAEGPRQREGGKAPNGGTARTGPTSRVVLIQQRDRSRGIPHPAANRAHGIVRVSLWRSARPEQRQTELNAQRRPDRPADWVCFGRTLKPDVISLVRKAAATGGHGPQRPRHEGDLAVGAFGSLTC